MRFVVLIDQNSESGKWRAKWLAENHFTHGTEAEGTNAVSVLGNLKTALRQVGDRQAHIQAIDEEDD